MVIVGAGAAGIGAGLELRERGIPFVILEAAKRVGGRAHTDRTSLSHAWDQGCHWLHCADVNPLVTWADRLGAEYVRQGWVDHLMMWSEGGWLDAAAARAARTHTTAAFDAIYAAAARDRDLTVAEVLPDAGPRARTVRHILQLMCCEDPERVSALGYADYADSGVNWPVASGMGDLVAGMSAGLPVRLAAPVSAVEQGPRGVRVVTPEGTLAARAAIVTVSTNVLRAGAIRFGPGPARDLLELIDDTPCGAYEKVAIEFRRQPVDEQGKLFCMVDPGGDAAPLDFQVAPGGVPLLIAHMGGSLARDMAAAGAAAMVDFAVERLSAAFGADIRSEIVAAATTAWQANPFVRGGYSYPSAGRAERRRRMIAADTGNVAFAGEAFSLRWQATAHGAYQSGRDVAARLAAVLAAGPGAA